MSQFYLTQFNYGNVPCLQTYIKRTVQALIRTPNIQPPVNNINQPTVEKTLKKDCVLYKNKTYIKTCTVNFEESFPN